MPDRTVEVRAVRPDEAAAFREVRLEAFKAHPTAFLTAYEEAAKLGVEEWRARMPDPIGRNRAFGIYTGAVLQGTASFIAETGAKARHTGQIVGVYVRPPLRGSGAADALLQAAIDHARQHIEVLKVSVTTDNPAARALYLRHGFRPYAIDPRVLRHAGRDYDVELMLLELKERS